MTDATPNNNKTARRMVPLRYVLMPFAIIFAAIILLIFVAMLAPKPAKKPIDYKAPLVNVLPITYEDVTFTISSQGSVIPRTQTNLVSEVAGNVTFISDKFFVGGFFRKGEELLHIDDITYQVALLQAQARLDSANAQLIEEQARSQQAKDEWSLTGKNHDKAPQLALRIPQLQQAKANVSAAEADLKEAKIKLQRTKIIAPYDAMLKAKQVDIGQYVTMGTVLATTFAVDYAEVRLPVRLRDLPFLNLPRINHAAEQTSAIELYYQLDGKKYQWPSQLTRYEGVVDSANRVHYIVAQVNDPYQLLSNEQTTTEGEIRIGTFVNANIEGKTVHQVFAIPRSAVHGAKDIYLVDDKSQLQLSQVDILRSDDNYVYTQQAFTSSDRLVLTNLDTPIQGMKLRISGEEPVNKVTTEEIATDVSDEE